MNAPMVVVLGDEPAEVGPDGVSVENRPDGGIVVDFAPQPAPKPAAVDPDNIAERLTPAQLDRIAERLMEMIDTDQGSRKEWYEKFTEGLRKCGALPVTVTPSFAGQSTTIHPLIMEAATQFQARAIAEIFPSTGAVKGKVLGPTNPEVEARAERVANYLNWQMTEQDVDYFSDVDQMLFVLPFAGSVFRKCFRDPDTGIVTSRFQAAEDVLLPGHYRGHIRSAPRVTHLFRLSHQDFLDRQDSGFYLPAETLRLQAPLGDTGREDRIDVQADGAALGTDVEEDREHPMAEVHLRKFALDRNAGGELGQARPYIITIERESRKVVAIRANWRTDGRGRMQPRCWWVHYKYLPGFGAYGYGLLHAIGGLGEAATEVLQEVLHSAKFAARQGGYTTREARLPEKMQRIEPGVYKQTDMTAEEIARAFYTPPYKEPSPALFNILGLLVDSGRRFASTADAMVGAGGENTPVGTTIARIEQGSKVYSAIHLRLHRAAGEEFKLRAELSREALLEPETGGASEVFVDGGVIQISADDFDERVDVAPVSDPNIVSTPQRVAMATVVTQRADAKPGLYDPYEVERQYLNAMRVPDIDRLLLRPDDLKPVDAVTEGQMVLIGKPIRAFVEQDHASHITVHQGQLAMLAGVAMAERFAPALQAHIAEHMAHQYRLEVQQALGVELPSPEMAAQGLPPEVDAQISRGAAMFVQGQLAQAAAAQQPDPNAPPSLAEREAEASVRQKEIAVERGLRELEMMGQDMQAQTQAVVQQAVAPLVEQIQELMAERDKARAALDKAAREFGDALAAAEHKRMQDEDRRRLEAADRARGDAEARAREADAALTRLGERLDAVQAAIERIGRPENEPRQTVVVDATGKALDTSGVQKDVASLKADIAAIAKVFQNVAAAIEASGKAQAEALEKLAQAGEASGTAQAEALVKLAEAEARRGTRRITVTPRPGGKGYDVESKSD